VQFSALISYSCILQDYRLSGTLCILCNCECIKIKKKDFVGASFTARMPLLTATSAFRLGRDSGVLLYSVIYTSVYLRS